MRRGDLVAFLLSTAVLTAGQASAQQHPNLEKGFKADQAYAVNDVDVVSLFNGNLNVSIPIGGTYTAGGTLTYGFAVAYAGNNWDYEEMEALVPTNDPFNPSVMGVIRWAVPYKPQNAGMGWVFSLGGRVTFTPRSTGPVYQAPDGSEHELYSAAVSYTKDATYIRSTRENVNSALGLKLEFPDGTIKRFDATGRLVRMEDQFGNSVSVAYYENPQAATAAGVPSLAGNECGSYRAWKVTDNHRAHFVYLKPSPSSYADFFEERVCRVNLAAFDAARAEYSFTYLDRKISRQKVKSREAYEEEKRPSPSLEVPLLKTITLPYGTTYDMLYDAGMYKPEGGTSVGLNSESTLIPNQVSDIGTGQNPGAFSGHLTALTIPTKGRYEWDYRRYAFPPAFEDPWDPSEEPPTPSSKPPSTVSVGVAVRRKFVGTTPDVWNYTQTFLSEGGVRTVAVTKVDAPAGTDAGCTANCRSVAENFFSVAINTHDVRDYDYGAPYDRSQDTSVNGVDMFLSQRTEVPGTTGMRRSYVLYEWDDSSDPSSQQIHNRRLKSRMTAFEDGSEMSEESKGYDGLGHYRTTTIKGTAGAVTRTTRKNYNPTSPPDGLRVIGEAEPWLTETFDTIETTDFENDVAISTSRTEFCFDAATGRLARTRSIRDGAASGRDLLAVFKDEPKGGTQLDGNVSQEEYYGGDDHPLPQPFSTCTGALSTLTLGYRLKHEYHYGSRSTTQYDATQGDTMNFKVLDLDIDANSGLPSKTRDVAGVETWLTYDLLGRLTSVGPAEPVPSDDRRTKTKYLYTEATASAGAKVAVTQECPSGSFPDCDASKLPEARYYYDFFGRLIQQRTSMGTAGTSPWSALVMTYNDVGGKKADSVAMGVSSGSFSTLTPSQKTEWSYDSLGRTTKITQPDASTVTIAYPTPNVIARTASIATTATGSTNVTTTETSDALGRLIKVTEDSTGAPIHTSYKYDTGDRLIRVAAGPGLGIQFRTFAYDGAGLLIEEDHPESDRTTFEYDARGHVTRRVIDTTQDTLLYEYDSAERLKNVFHDPDGSGPALPKQLKKFTFGSTSGTTGLGRLVSATRYNYLPWLGGTGVATVIEALAYDASGRLSSKMTAVGIPGNSDRTFTDSYTYDYLGATKAIGYPSCTNCGITPPEQTIENFYEHGFLKSISGFASGIQYHPNGMWAQITRPKATGSGVQTTDNQTLAANQMPRPASLSVSGYCSFSITGPSSKTVSSNSDANLEVTAPAGSTFQWYVGDSPGTEIPDATGSTLHYQVSATTSFWVRVGQGGCTIDSNVALVTVSTCSGAATIVVPSLPRAGGTASASVQEAGTYAWTIQNGVIDPATVNSQTVAFTAGCSGSVVLTVSFKPTCASTATPTSATIPITTPVGSLGASPSPLPQGSVTTLNVSINGGPWMVKWADQSTPMSVTNFANRQQTVSPIVKTTYSLSEINDCPASSSWSVTVPVVPPSPLTTSATRIGTTIVQVTWTKPAGATIHSYIIERCMTSCASGGSWVTAGTTASMSFDDQNILVNKAYVYRVKSVLDETSSSPGPKDFASTYVFTDDPLITPGPQSNLHIVQLRLAVNALRSAAGLSAATFTDAMTPGLLVKAIYLTELRAALNSARDLFNRGHMEFTQPAPATGGLPLAAHVHDLRGGVQ